MEIKAVRRTALKRFHPYATEKHTHKRLGLL